MKTLFLSSRIILLANRTLLFCLVISMGTYSSTHAGVMLQIIPTDATPAAINSYWINLLAVFMLITAALVTISYVINTLIGLLLKYQHKKRSAPKQRALKNNLPSTEIALGNRKPFDNH